jgi:hypothetical protein
MWQPGRQRLQLVPFGQDEVCRTGDARNGDVGAGRLRQVLVADRLVEHGVDDQVRLADPACRQALAGHRRDDLLDVLPADAPDLPVPDGGVHVPFKERAVADDGDVRAEVLREPRLGLGSEGDAGMSDSSEPAAAEPSAARKADRRLPAEDGRAH